MYLSQNCIGCNILAFYLKSLQVQALFRRVHFSLSGWRQAIDPDDADEARVAIVASIFPSAACIVRGQQREQQ